MQVFQIQHSRSWFKIFRAAPALQHFALLSTTSGCFAFCVLIRLAWLRAMAGCLLPTCAETERTSLRARWGLPAPGAHHSLQLAFERVVLFE